MKIILRNKVLNWIVCGMLLMTAVLCPASSARAATVYVSDGILYDEGYIFVGESHMQIAAFGMQQDALGNIPGLDGIHYSIYADSSVVSNDLGDPGTFTMFGNLFFVFEGTGRTEEARMQISKEYIYSDGAGKQGGAVPKIHLMPFFWEHYPQGLMDVDQKVDMVHWSSQTYYEMVCMIIKQIQEKRGANTLVYSVVDVQAVL